MDKKNDIKVNKVSKWKAAPENMRTLFTYIELVIGMACSLPPEIHDNLYDLMDKTLDEYNELEAKYQESCGMISQYEEENRKLHLRISSSDAFYKKLQTDYCDIIEMDLNQRYHKRFNELKSKVANLEKENEDLENRLAQQKQGTGVMLSQYEEENLSLREQVNKLINARIELTGDNDDLRRECGRHIDLLDKLRWALEDKGIYCEWNEAALKWRLHGKDKLIDELKQHYEEELRIREKEKDDKDKLIEELTHENMVLKLKNYSNRTYGLTGKIEELEKENKELKDTLAKDREVGKYVGKCVADSIQEGWKNGAYELHPSARFDIHVEETNNRSTTFNRHAIPAIAVMFNNTQTEMERDTAQHECKELDKKVDRLWSVNEELNRKIKELKKDNKELKATLAVCAVDANAAKNLCNGIVSKVKRTRDNKEEK